ncbi:MAG: cupin domain-containing protein [Deltaproteobacteria bacterium]|nr:cupin domain-containing protein [Deltaproteobacteria bacterium]
MSPTGGDWRCPWRKIRISSIYPKSARRRLSGQAIGAQKLGYSFFTVPRGKVAFPFHLHNGNEEMIFILEGEAILRLGKEEISVSAGTFVACPPGPDHPHQLINTSDRDLRYLVVSTMEYPEISEYPDSNKIGAYVTSAGAQAGFRALYFKDASAPYYEGESGAAIERIKKS